MMVVVLSKKNHTVPEYKKQNWWNYKAIYEKEV